MLPIKNNLLFIKEPFVNNRRFFFLKLILDKTNKRSENLRGETHDKRDNI